MATRMLVVVEFPDDPEYPADESFEDLAYTLSRQSFAKLSRATGNDLVAFGCSGHVPAMPNETIKAMEDPKS